MDALERLLFKDYVKRKALAVSRFFRRGLLSGAIKWDEMTEPTGPKL